MSYATLMVCCDLSPQSDTRLQIAASLAERFEARVIGIAAQAEMIPITLEEGSAFSDVDNWEQNQAKIAQRLQLVETRFRDTLKGRARDIDWRSAVAEPASFIAKECRAADLVIVGKHPDDTNLDPADLIVQAGRPLLMIPDEIDIVKTERVLIAWKDTREARRAICDALPLLRLCQKAVVAEIDEELDPAAAHRRVEDVVAWLACHNVDASAWSEPLRNEPAAQLDALALKEGLDLIIAGAYGRGKFREWVFGGVTRDLLEQNARPILVAH